VWTYFLKQDGACSNTSNAFLDLLHDVLVTMSCGIDFQSASGVGGSGHHDMNTCNYFLWVYLKDSVYCANPHNIQELQIEI